MMQVLRFLPEVEDDAFAVYFRLEDNEIVVFGLFHCARDPRTTRAALRIRGESGRP